MTTDVSSTSERNLRILLANEREEDLRALGDVLDGLGHEVTPFAVSVAEATELIAREDPDVAFVVLDGDDEHGLALIAETVTFASGPVLVTVREAESASTRSRGRRTWGSAGYVDSWAPADVQGAIDVAVRRHREEAAAQREGGAAGVGAGPACRHRAGQGHPDGAPRPERPGLVRAAARARALERAARRRRRADRARRARAAAA